MSLPTQDSFATDAATCHFNVQTPGHAVARKAAYSARHVAFGNMTIVQLGGRLEATRHFQVYLPNESELENLDACLGLQGTLSYHKGDFVAALVSYDARGWWADNDSLCDLEFVLDGD